MLSWSSIVAATLWLMGPVIVVAPAPGFERPASPLLLPIEVGYQQSRTPAVAPALPVVSSEPVPRDSASPAAQMAAMEAAYGRVRDYTATLLKMERVKGALLPRETIHVKFRKPFSLYLRWSGPVNPGREVLYVRGANEGRLRAHPGSFPDVTVDLKPTSALAMKGNRHPITQASLGDLIALMLRDLRRSEARPQDSVLLKDLGESVRFGARVRCLDARFPDGAGYYAPHVRLCSFVANQLPSRVQVWDVGERLLEDYEYRDLRINVGLGARDFASDNPAYKF